MHTFNFTAFAASDLFETGSAARHKTFTMPEEATLDITVTDNDNRLSGDARRNEIGDDGMGQTATITRDGAEVGNTLKLYAEQIWFMHGDDGKTYRMVELEQPGTLQDSFSFYYGTPPAGVTLTLVGASNVFGKGIRFDAMDAGELKPALPNIVEIAAGSDDFNILVQALSAAGLVGAVQNSDDITVFAPTDAAFAQLAADLGYTGSATDEDAVFGYLVEQLTALGNGDPIPLLTDILLYHVSPTAKSAAEVDAADSVATLLEGATFTTEGTELNDNEPDVVNPNIVAADIAASNGTIQVIDRVLIPLDIPGNEPALPNIVEIAAGSDDFNILVQALSAAGLVEAVQNSDDITVFAPTDAAFAQLAADLGYTGSPTDEDAVFGYLVEQLTALGNGDPIPLLTDILLYHVSPTAKTAAEVDAADTVTTLLEGATFTTEGTELNDNEPDVANPNIVAADIAASNGTIQVIDRVLIPLDIPGNTAEPDPLPTLTAIVAASGGTFDQDGTDFDLLLNAVQAAGLAGALDDPEADLTVFAPNDAAFISLAQALGFKGHDEGEAFGYIVEALTLLGGGDPIPLLTQVLTYHVAPEALDSTAVLASDEIATLQGGTLGVDGATLVDADPDVANPNLIATDIQASNGIAHVIDGVLLPADLLQSDGSNDVDFIIGREVRDRVWTGDDNDFVDGNGGNDRIALGAGDDVGVGGSGRDVIYGGSGDDTITGGTGNDKLWGGSGNDTFVFASGDGYDWIFGFQDGQDQIDLSGTGIADFAELSGAIHKVHSHMSFIDLEGHDGILIRGTNLDLTAEDFIF